MNIKRGDVFWIALDPSLGTESKKTRPGVVLSNNSQNKEGRRVIIAPMTSVISKIYPFEVFVEVAGKKSKVMLDQIRAIDSSRIRGESLGRLTVKELEQVNQVLKKVLELGCSYDHP
jgi:mRNA interferase MazF